MIYAQEIPRVLPPLPQLAALQATRHVRGITSFADTFVVTVIPGYTVKTYVVLAESEALTKEE